jgi:hypothetical protein
MVSPAHRCAILSEEAQRAAAILATATSAIAAATAAVRAVSAVLATVALLLAPAAASAQRSPNWNQDHDPYVAAVGLAAGLTSGTGLAMRWPALPQTMATLAGGIWRQNGKSDWNLGLELHLVLRQAVRTRLFVGPALAVYHDGNGGGSNWNVSAGVGFEHLIARRMALKADVGFTRKGDTGDIYPLPQIAAFYYF